MNKQETPWEFMERYYKELGKIIADGFKDLIDDVLKKSVESKKENNNEQRKG